MIETLLAIDFAPTGNVALPVSGSDSVGAVGHFVAAMLQTAGLYAQHEVLTSFQEVLRLTGTFIYIIAILGAIVLVALFGSYKRAMYVMISPALFYAVQNTTVMVRATTQQTGVRQVASSSVDQLTILRQITGNPLFDQPAKVSWLFVKYDQVISQVVQNVVAVLIDTKNQADILQDARERAFSRLLMADGIDQGYLRLTSLGAMGSCAKVTGVSTDIAGAQKEIDWLTQAAAKRQGSLQTETNSELKVWTDRRAELQKRYDIMKSERNVQLDTESKHYVKDVLKNDLADQPALNCEEIWGLVHSASMKEAENWLAQLDDDLSQDFGASGAAHATVWESIKKDIEGAFNAHPGEAAQMIAGYILKNTLLQTTNGTLTRSIAGRESIDEIQYERAYGNLQGHEARGMLSRIKSFSGFVPYIQGLLLFILSISFPFYAIFLLIPGRVESFFSWFGLWLWVKSWDVGFAMVHILRKVLWTFIHHDNSIVPQATMDWSSPHTVFRAVYSHDPLANISIFFNVTAIATLSIPYMTAELCLGANKLFNSFKGAITEDSEGFGNNVTRGSKQGEANKMNVILSRNEGIYATKMAIEAGKNSGMTEDGVRRALTGDATLPRHIAEAYAKAKYEYHFSNEQMSTRMEVAMLTGRRMTYSAQASKEYVNALMNNYNEQYRARTAGTGNDVPFLASNQTGSSSGNINIFSSTARGGDLPEAAVQNPE